MGDFSHLGAAWLARLAHDALERGGAATLAAVRTEIARRAPAERLACSREWTRQAPHRERARNEEARSAPEHWGILASELRRLVSTDLDDRRGARDGGASKPACFDPLGLPEAFGLQGCSTLWNAEEVEEAIEAADGGAEAVLGE